MSSRSFRILSAVLSVVIGMSVSSALNAEDKPATETPVKTNDSPKPAPAKDGPKKLAVLPPAASKALYERVTPSLVAVQYTFSGELGRQEIIGPGIVVDGTGLVMTSMSMVPPQIPNEQMIDFKILIPGDAETEIEATFEGRDERTGVHPRRRTPISLRLTC